MDAKTVLLTVKLDCWYLVWNKLYKISKQSLISLFWVLFLGSEQKKKTWSSSFFRYIWIDFFFVVSSLSVIFGDFLELFQQRCHCFIPFPIWFQDMLNLEICLYCYKAVLCLSCIKYRCFDLNIDMASILNYKYRMLTTFLANCCFRNVC